MPWWVALLIIVADVVALWAMSRFSDAWYEELRK